MSNIPRDDPLKRRARDAAREALPARGIRSEKQVEGAAVATHMLAEHGGNVADIGGAQAGHTHKPLNNREATAAPGVTDDTTKGYEVGSEWDDVTNDKAYVCLDATEGAAVWTETTAGASGGYTTIEDEGTPLTQRTTIDFVGAGVTADDFGSETRVTIPGGAGHDAVTLAADAQELLNLSTQELGLVAKAANLIFAGPASGGAADPTFRAMVLADLIAHAASHQNGGADEIATATPGANAIPKAGAGGKLAAGWIQEVLAYADLTDDPAVLKTLFDAHTILMAVSDDTPTALAVAASRIIGRKASGNIGALTGAEILAILSAQAGAEFSWNSQKLVAVADLDLGGVLLKNSANNLYVRNTADSAYRSVVCLGIYADHYSGNAGTGFPFRPIAACDILGLPVYAGDPSGIQDGDVWYNSSTNKFRKYENGAASDLDTDTVWGATEHTAIGDGTPHHAKYLDSEAITAAKTVKLDDFTIPDDNTDLDASTAKHGLLKKLGGGTTNFLRADGSWAAPSGGGKVSKSYLFEFPDEDMAVGDFIPENAIRIPAAGKHGDITWGTAYARCKTVGTGTNTILFRTSTTLTGARTTRATMNLGTSREASGAITLTESDGMYLWVACSAVGGTAPKKVTVQIDCEEAVY